VISGVRLTATPASSPGHFNQAISKSTGIGLRQVYSCWRRRIIYQLPIPQALCRKNLRPYSVWFQFDAHSDTWPDDDMDRSTTVDVIYKAVNRGIVDPKTRFKVGIRTTIRTRWGPHDDCARGPMKKGHRPQLLKIKQVLGRPFLVSLHR